MKSEALRELLANVEKQEAAETLAAVARIVGIGEASLTSRDRSADTTRRRAVAAWILCERLKWSTAKAAQHLCRTDRQVRRLIASQM